MQPGLDKRGQVSWAASAGADTLDLEGRRGPGCRETRAYQRPSVILSPRWLLHHHRALSSRGTGMRGFGRSVQRPVFWSWLCPWCSLLRGLPLDLS